MADTAAIARAVSVASAARAVPAKIAILRTRSKNNGRSWCTPSVFPPPQDLPVHGSERAEDRLQGFQAADALRLRARQDRAEPHHGGFRQEATRARPRHQARAVPGSASLRHSLSSLRSAGMSPPVATFIRLPGHPVADGWGGNRL